MKLYYESGTRKEGQSMNTLAYINGSITTEQYEELLKKDVTSILIDVPRGDRSGQQIARSLKQIVNDLTAGDQLIIYDLSNLYRTLSELAVFFRELKEKRIDLVILKKDEIFSSMTQDDFMNFIFDVNYESQEVIKEKKIRADKHSKKAGRPKVEQDNIDKMRHLRLDKHYTLKDTAELCGVSVGTVYKYADCQK